MTFYFENSSINHYTSINWFLTSFSDKNIILTLNELLRVRQYKQPREQLSTKDDLH